MIFEERFALALAMGVAHNAERARLWQAYSQAAHGERVHLVASSSQHEKVVDVARNLAAWAGVPFVDEAIELHRQFYGTEVTHE